jgi:hypothetical protein
MAQQAELNRIGESSPVVGAAHPQRWPWLVALVWISAVVLGVAVLSQYSATPGESARPPAQWPENSQIALNHSGQTLVIFAHPKCPCTRSNLHELQRILTNSPKTVTVWAVFYRPLDATANWEQSDLWEQALAIDGVHAISDPDGALARRFGVFTSGQTLLYDSAGDLQFSGGITSSRGHEDDNVGQAAIIEFLNHGTTSIHQTPVFGCAIASPTARPQ